MIRKKWLILCRNKTKISPYLRLTKESMHFDLLRGNIVNFKHLSLHSLVSRSTQQRECKGDNFAPLASSLLGQTRWSMAQHACIDQSR